MNSDIRTIFEQNIELIESINKGVFYFRVQNYTRALLCTKAAIELLSSMLEPLLKNQAYFNADNSGVEIPAILSILPGILEVQETGDYLLLADLYEMQLLRYVIAVQEVIIGKEEFTFRKTLYLENVEAIQKRNTSLATKLRSATSPIDLQNHGYVIEPTSSGLMTLARKKEEQLYYLHSNGMIMQEAFFLAKEWQKDGIYHYIVYGLGLGYHIKELAKLNPEAEIDVYDSDLNVIQLACGYTDFKKIVEQPNVNIIYDPDFSKLSSLLTKLNEEATFVIHYPSLMNIKDESVKEQLEQYFMHKSSVNNQVKAMNDNFRNNSKNYNHSIDKLRERFEANDLYIIAAGPSLDKNVHELRKIGKNGVILSTGTVLRKLLQEEIVPDYFIVTDPTKEAYAQFEGLEQIEIPFIGLSTAYKDFMKYGKGEKYIVCQNGYAKAEEYAKVKGYQLYNTGGSVSTCALDLGIQMNCKRIIFVGLDLAFTNNSDHATNTPTRENIITEKAILVEDVNGNSVYTKRNLNIYRQWIEERIAGVTGIEIIDATEGGAKIKGMKLQRLADAIEGNNHKGGL